VAGVKHTCAIKSDATVACWGYNSSAQIGSGNFTNWDRPFSVPGLTDMIAVAAGDRATCAVKRGGTVHCWGDSVNLPPVAMDFPGITARSVAMGSNHKCLVTTDDDIHCWGSGTVGQLGDGLSTSSATLVRPTYASNNEVLTGVVEASLGLNHTCALRDDGAVACWGDNDLDAIANGGNRSAFARNVPGITTAVSLASGPYYTCVALADGTVKCWGALTGAGSGAAAQSPVPVEVPGLSDIVRVAAGEGGTCALRRDRRLYCWGYEGTVDVSYTPRLERRHRVLGDESVRAARHRPHEHDQQRPEPGRDDRGGGPGVLGRPVAAAPRDGP
jgi:alpha-tubulin suppressor-like RCC1 family protein